MLNKIQQVQKEIQSTNIDVQPSSIADQDQNTNSWSEVVRNQSVYVKVDANPLSNMYECNLPAYGQTFRTLEHGFQSKKCLDNNLVGAFEEVKKQLTGKLSKTKADELVPKEMSEQWEAQSIPTMKYLLCVKKDTCKEFVSSLLGTGNKKIIHNVASRKWGSGPDGKGDNIFGNLLMELRSEIIEEMKVKKVTSKTFEKPQPTTNNVNHNTPEKGKRRALLLGNSLLNGINPNKLSKDLTVISKDAYTVKEAMECIQNLVTTPDAVVLQLGTNEAKSNLAVPDKRSQRY